MQATEQHPALVLVGHGSPDPDWRQPLEQAYRRLQALLPRRRVILAYLEFTAPNLLEAVTQLRDEGVSRAIVMAAFLSPGGKHIKQHLPDLVRATGQQVPEVALELVPGSLGSEPEVVEALARAAIRIAESR